MNADAFRSRRRALLLTPSELAEAFGVSVRTLCAWEGGRQPSAKHRKLAERFSLGHVAIVQASGRHSLMPMPSDRISKHTESSDLLSLFVGVNGDGEGVMTFVVEFDREDDGRWIADVVSAPDGIGATVVYGDSREDAFVKLAAVTFHEVARCLESGVLKDVPLRFAFVESTSA